LQWYRPHHQRMPHLPGRRRRKPHETVDFRIKPGTRDGQRIRLQGKGNAGVNGALRATCSSSSGLAPIPYLRAWATIFNSPSGHGSRGLAGSQSRRAHHRRARPIEDSPRHAERAKTAHEERGVESAQHAGQRGDQIVTIEVMVPHLQDERSREIMRELAKLNNQDPRVALFDKM